jgi:hypothetical protein
MIKVSKPVVRETVKKQIEVSDLDNVVDVQLFGVHPDGDFWEHDWIHDYANTYWKNNEHIPIAILEDVVQQLKALGSTHVQIYPHGDHQSYYFTGVKLEVISEEEAKEREKKTLETAIKNHKIRMQLDKDELEKSNDFLLNLQTKLEELSDD